MDDIRKAKLADEALENVAGGEYGDILAPAGMFYCCGCSKLKDGTPLWIGQTKYCAACYESRSKE